MATFDWITASIVIVSMIYLSFVLTLAEWLAALRKGQAVTLLPERKGGTWPLWTQIGIVILGLLLCVPLFYYLWIPLARLSANTANILDILGLVIYLAGCAFVLWARRTLGKMWGLSTSRNVKLLDDHQLVQSGPFAFVRHPMYFGWGAAMFGLLLLYPTWVVLLFLVSSVMAFFGRARREEVALAERFSEAWTEYKKHTRFLIPFIY
ncbi:MAG: isoprenylcysteine carboxylmethyltransferase family protein [Anaerolineales bacterium]|nr:isoprenylcysteine carboxylmethyltransferase family protein [Anaerolineales bacterium]